MSCNASADVVFLLDVDNTLLDNDRIIFDLRRHLETTFGVASSDCYWAIFEELRKELGYADYLGALQRYRANAEHGGSADEPLLLMSSFLIDYPFAERLYPRTLDVIAHLGRSGPTVILSDGDVVFQPRKVQRSGLWDAVGGRVLIYVHKEQMLDAVQRHYPARQYVMVDDKLRLLTAMKTVLGGRVTTVFPRQGHYALDPANASLYPAADITVERIGDLLGVDNTAWLDRSGSQTGQPPLRRPVDSRRES
ncbi:MAG: HAD family hydrolase [Rhodoferax sp.]|nr:HAD family hydrolase [Rhodoferax sp.]